MSCCCCCWFKGKHQLYCLFFSPDRLLTSLALYSVTSLVFLHANWILFEQDNCQFSSFGIRKIKHKQIVKMMCRLCVDTLLNFSLVLFLFLFFLFSHSLYDALLFSITLLLLYSPICLYLRLSAWLDLLLSASKK